MNAVEPSAQLIVLDRGTTFVVYVFCSKDYVIDPSCRITARNLNKIKPRSVAVLSMSGRDTQTRKTFQEGNRERKEIFNHVDESTGASQRSKIRREVESSCWLWSVFTSMQMSSPQHTYSTQAQTMNENDQRQKLAKVETIDNWSFLLIRIYFETKGNVCLSRDCFLRIENYCCGWMLPVSTRTRYQYIAVMRANVNDEKGGFVFSDLESFSCEPFWYHRANQGDRSSMKQTEITSRTDSLTYRPRVRVRSV